MKIAIFSPYLPDHFGGGEKYILDVARVLATEGHQVEVVLPAQSKRTPAALEQIKYSYEGWLGQSLQGVTFSTTPLGTSQSAWKKLIWTRRYDVLYYLTDGSLFFSLAKRNILHIQLPFTDSKSSPVDRLKLANWQVINTNSAFTKSVIEQHWQTKVDAVHYPMVEWASEAEAAGLKTAPKEKVILSVGRFFRQLHSKRQDIMVAAFKQLSSTQISREWKLVLIGGVEDSDYLAEISKQAKGLPIEIHTQVTRSELLDWYNRASIYWHAAGFEIDPQQHPAKVEHFGISTVEAMAAGCVPVVHGKGGQLEVVGKSLLPYTWQSINECVEKTSQLIAKPRLRSELAELARQQSAHFGRDRFERVLKEMLYV